MILKVIGRLVGDTVIEDVLVGTNAEELRHAGTLRLRPVEWQMLNAVLGLGADRMDGDIMVVIDGPSDIADSAQG